MSVALQLNTSKLEKFALYRPFTATQALAVTFPAGFSASQRYIPSCSDFLASVISTSEILATTVLPFRYQVIRGTGNPRASHSKIMVSPSLMEIF